MAIAWQALVVVDSVQWKTVILYWDLARNPVLYFFTVIAVGFLQRLYCSLSFLFKKPANILVMGEGAERGKVKIGVYEFTTSN